jgi:hypothetical protein
MRSTKFNLLGDGGKPRKPVPRWPVAGPSGYILTSSERSGKQKNIGFPTEKYPAIHGLPHTQGMSDEKVRRGE